MSLASPTWKLPPSWFSTAVNLQKSSLEELKNENHSLRAIAGKLHAELLHSLKQDHPHLEWDERPEVIMFQLMEQVQNREIDYAVVDSAIFELERSMFPRVEAALGTLRPGTHQVWHFPKTVTIACWKS
ncbi:MAG: hypothetical protein ACFHHU_13810 [Porticoccaceae bacterium]